MRIPPLVLLVFWAVYMRFLHWADNGSLDFRFRGQTWIAAAILLVGMTVAGAGVLTFHRASTTVDPLRPERASRLVTNGIYRYTRNPMYLGMTLALLAWAIYLGSSLVFLALLAFPVCLTHFQIVPEEEVLLKKFGGAFQRYQQQVRRWL